MPAVTTKKDRLRTLDHLRGFFIVVIIIDHLARWPSILALATGKGMLWVTAAEGFVAISGLLVGYVRGYKNRNLPMREVSKKLLKRALLLYVWSLIASIFYTIITWYVPQGGGTPIMPFAHGDWATLISELLTMRYTYPWVYFLTFYALFLAASPIVIWLFRRNLAWLVAALSLMLLITGWLTHIPALEWQFLFFIPSIAGFYLPRILSWWRSLKNRLRTTVTASTITLTVATIAISFIFTFYLSTDDINALFAKDTISLWRAGLASLWFIGFVLVFNIFQRFISRYLGWLLVPIGTNSLTAYIVHGVALATVSFFASIEGNIFANTALGIVVVMLTWSLLKIPYVRRIVPS